MNKIHTALELKEKIIKPITKGKVTLFELIGHLYT